MEKIKSRVDVYERLRKAEESPAWNRASAYVIMRGAEYVGKILCKHPHDGMGPLELFLWDWTGENSINKLGIQRARITGCGFDKLAAGMDGLIFGGIELKDHPTDWKTQLRDAGYTLLSVL